MMLFPSLYSTLWCGHWLRLARCPGLWWRGALWDACRLRINPGFSVAISCWFRHIGSFAQRDRVYQSQQVKFFILLAHNHVVARLHTLTPEVEDIDRFRALFAASRQQPFLVGAIEDGLCRADRRAHWPFALARAVIAQVALLHVVAVHMELGHTKGAGEAAVLAVDAARLIGTLHHAIGTDQDGLRGTDLRAGGQWVLAVHAQRR